MKDEQQKLLKTDVGKGGIFSIIKIILFLGWMYVVQGFVISFPSVLKTVMAYEIDMCEDKREIDQYLSYALMPFSIKNYLRSDSRLWNSLSSKVTNISEAGYLFAEW